MRVLASPRPLLHLLVAFVLLAAPAAAQDTPFRRVKLAYGISLEIPARWNVLPKETRQSLEATRETITRNAGIEKPAGKTEGLLAVNATPDPAGAMIRLNVTSPSEYTQDNLAATTAEGLQALRSELLAMFQRLEASSGPRILDVHTPRIEPVNDRLALVIPYIRAGAKGAAPWEVTQYKIPVSGRLVEMTLSHRQSDASEWKPLLEHARRSLRF